MNDDSSCDMDNARKNEENKEETSLVNIEHKSEFFLSMIWYSGVNLDKEKRRLRLSIPSKSSNGKIMQINLNFSRLRQSLPGSFF